MLLDPYGRGVVVPPKYIVPAAAQPGDNAATAMKSVVVDPSTYDWEGDEPLRRPSARTIIYEMHVRGFTRDPSSGVAEAKRGTYAGLIEKIPYLQELGVTAVELLPVFQFDAQDAPPGRVNYWGYAPVSFFAPHPAYSSRQDPLGPLDEFRDLVKALHRAGLEVILDVVFNHTAEGNENGPTLCFRGIENEAYYILEPDRSRYANYSGTGNTLNANHPVVRRMIVDSLRYWVGEMHVDGFRFDLASILARDGRGHVTVPLTLPMILTVGRLVLAPVYFLLYQLAGAAWPCRRVAGAWLVFVLIEISDLLDGHLARKLEQESEAGKVLDPLADSLSRLTYFVCFTVAGIMPAWVLLVLVYRDVGVSYIRVLFSRGGVLLPARTSGKVKAWVYAFAGGLGLADFCAQDP